MLVVVSSKADVYRNMIRLQKLNSLKLYPSLMYHPQGLLDVSDLVSTSMNEELESAINLLDQRSIDRPSIYCIGTTAKLIQRCKCGQYQDSDVVQYEPPTFTITLLVCKSLTVANWSLRSLCKGSGRTFLFVGGVLTISFVSSEWSQ